MHFVEILTEVGNFGEIKFEIHGVLSDACILDNCCVTKEQEKITCFVMNADSLTMLCREDCKPFLKHFKSEFCSSGSEGFFFHVFFLIFHVLNFFFF